MKEINVILKYHQNYSLFLAIQLLQMQTLSIKSIDNHETSYKEKKPPPVNPSIL